MKIKPLLGHLLCLKNAKNAKLQLLKQEKSLLKKKLKKLLDMESIAQEAIELAERNGIIFLDEIDKVQ